MASENRGFQERWEIEYLHTYNKDEPLCLVCEAHMAVMKEYNINRHFELNEGQREKKKVNERGLFWHNRTCLR